MTGNDSSADEIWLAATWPFVREQLPRRLRGLSN
jgi:hypothetical protein